MRNNCIIDERKEVFMKRFSAWILALCMFFSVVQTAVAEIGDEVVADRDNFEKISGQWYTSENASGIHYQNKGIYCTGNDASAKISYTLTDPGIYEVFWFFSGLKADSGECELSVPTAEGKQTVQFVANTASGWKSMGRYNMEAGQNSVLLTCKNQSRFSGLKLVYRGKNVSISSDIYSVDNVSRCIFNIPYGTTADEFLGNINSENMQNIRVCSIEGTQKTGVLEDGDRLCADADGEKFEYYLKTYIDGVKYGDDFNYKNYEEYMAVQTALNKSKNKNLYSAEDVVTSQVAEYNGEKVLAMAPNKNKKPGMQYYRFNTIGFDDVSGKIVIEYDIMQKNLDQRGVWAYVVGDYSDGNPTFEDKYALWGSNLAGRGTLMRDSAHSARWLSFEGKQLIMTSDRIYSVKQIIDFDGDIEIYINGQKAMVTDENLENEKSKSMQGFGGIKGIGLGLYLENASDWSAQDGDFAVMWDHVRVYEPSKYAGHFIKLLPGENDNPPADLAEKIEKARNIVEEVKQYGVTEEEIPSMDLLNYWEEQTQNVSIGSEIFAIDNEKKTVTGILKGMTVAEFTEKLQMPKNYSAEVVGKADGDVVESGDVLRVANIFGKQAEYTLAADRNIIVLDYDFAADVISNVPYATSVDDFVKHIVYPKHVTVAVYSGETLNSGTVKDGDVLRITLNGEESSFSISVVAASAENYVVDAGEYTVLGNVISGIAYNTAFGYFKKQIKVSALAEIIYPYADDYKGSVYDGDMIKVVAQNGEERIYTLEVSGGRSTAELSGTGKITVDPEGHIIYGVQKGTSVAEFLDMLEVSNGGSLKFYAENGEEIKDGNISGTETVRVFPEYPEPGREYEIYTISCDKELVQENDIIVTAEDEGFSFDGDKNVSGSAVEPGYNGMTTIYINEGTGRFTPELPESGEYNVYVYTSYHSSNKPYPATICHDGGKEEVTVAQNEKSGWKYLGTYKFAKGKEGYLECANTTGGGFARLSAAKFESKGSYKEISEVQLADADGTEQISEGLNKIRLRNDLNIKIKSDVELSKGDIKIISKNANTIDFEISQEEGVFVIRPKYNFRKEVTYYLSINSEKLSKAYTYVLEGEEDFAAAASVRLPADSTGGEIKVNLELVNQSGADKNVKILICCYSDAFSLQALKMTDAVAKNGENTKIAETLETSAAVKKENVRVFVWDGELKPVTEVYYR